jgi:hypothetical protein
MPSILPWRAAALCAVLLFLAPAPAWSYGGDTHYYLCYANALAACFDWDEAHLIASANYLIDKNRTTTAEKHPFKTHNKINWHAFGRDEERFNALWERVLAEEDPTLQLVKLGQFLHYISDWESHYGYGVRIGHGVGTFRGKDPDSLGANRMNNFRMIDQTIDHMVKVCVARGREVGRGDDPDLFRSNLYKELADDAILDEMFLYNSRKWKSWGVRGKKGKAILAKNHLLIEQAIHKRRAQLADRGIPDDFTPGDPDRGLPPPIGLRFAQNGDLLEVYGVEIELRPEYLGDDLAKDREDALEEALETEFVDDLEEMVGQEDDSDLDASLAMEILDADLQDRGWRVTVRVRNLGGGISDGGDVEIVVLDIASEELLGEASRPFSPVRGRETIQQEILVPAEGEPSKTILIGASLNMEDLSADNNDVWYVPWREGIEADEGKKKMKKGGQNLSVELLGTPKMWVDATGEGAWIVLRALVSGGHSSRRLEKLEMALLGEEGRVPVTINEGQPAVWMSVPDLRRRVVPSEVLAWFRFDPELCAASEEISLSPTAIEITVSGSEIRTTAREFPLLPEIPGALAAECATDDGSRQMTGPRYTEEPAR